MPVCYREGGIPTENPVTTNPQNPPAPVSAPVNSVPQAIPPHKRSWIIPLIVGGVVVYLAGVAYLIVNLLNGNQIQLPDIFRGSHTESAIPGLSAFQTLLVNNCKSGSKGQPSIGIDESKLPIVIHFKAYNIACIKEWHSQQEKQVLFTDGTQAFILFEKYWPYDTELLAGDATADVRPNAKGILIRSVGPVDQYIRLESSENRFAADKTTWIGLHSVKKSPSSDLKILTNTILVDEENTKLLEALTRHGISHYDDSAAMYTSLMENLVRDLLTPVGPAEMGILDEQLNKLNQIDFK